MPTKKIQLRGISRTPSDRMSADGGLAESIGFETDMQELAVNVPPEDVTAELGLGDIEAEVVFIHKTNEYTNYVGKNDTGVGWLIGDTFEHFYTYTDGETLKEVKSIGNTLVMLLSDMQGATTHMEYVLYKEGQYKRIGGNIPEPHLKVRCRTMDTSAGYYYGAYSTKIACSRRDDSLKELVMNCSHRDLVKARVESWSESQRDFQGYKTLSAYNEVQEELRADLDRAIRHNLMNGALSLPVMMRYAVRLYDGSYVNHSAPILLDPDAFDVDKPLTSLTFQYTIGSNDSCVTASGDFIKPYKMLMTVFEASDFEDWQDVVAGVDLFVTPQMERFGMELYDVNGEDTMPTQTDIYQSTLNITPLTEDEKRERILKESNFYVFKRYDIKEWMRLNGRLFETKQFNGSYEHPEWDDSAGIEDYLEAFDPLTLVVRDRLSDDNHSHDTLIPRKIRVYNERLLLAGINVRHYSGYYDMPSTAPWSGNTPNKDTYYRIRYYIRSESGQTAVVEQRYQEKLDGNTTHPHPRLDYRLGNWLYYPDTRCYKARVMMTEETQAGTYTEETVEAWRDFDMEEHPYLNGAYHIIPPGTDMQGGEGWNTGAVPTEEKNAVTSRGNTIMQSKAFNMFVFGGERSFPGEVTDVAVITKPLSAGQVGYSSLYVFTEEGLWALGTEADGSMGKLDSISQDVALPDTVCQLDQAVVFTSKKGVMLLTGMDLRCISDKMHGRHYKLDAAVHSLLAGVGSEFKQDWGDLADMAYEDLPFMDYMQESRTAYDYVGRRLLFFSVADNPQPYIYTYMIETDSWHKVVMPAGYEFRRVLNSYPDTFIAMDKIVSTTVEQVTTTERYAAMLCFSNARSQSEATRYKAMLVTRPMDLDEDDVRKVLNRLFIRGSYPKTFLKSAQVEDRPVKMVVLGSADGQTWQILRSFRGGSYKLFRLVLLCQLTQAERISYVEAEYESRYTNRLR